jgi:hypothetical protein
VGVPIVGALFVIAVYLANEAVHIDDQPLIARAGTCRPRAPETVSQHLVELADVPKGERAQKRAQRRRRRDTMPEHRPGLPRAQHIAVIDAVRPQAHRTDHRHHLPARIRCARPLAEINGPVDQSLDTKPTGEHRGEHHARVRDHPLVVEHNAGAVRQTVHHAGDPLVQDPQPLARPVLPAQGVI